MVDDIERFIARFDPYSAELSKSEDFAFEVYAAMRERCPVAHSESHGGFWAVSRYQDLMQVLLDDDTFRTSFGAATLRSMLPMPDIEDPAELKPYNGATPIPSAVDAPLYFEYRRPMNPMFSPDVARKMEPGTREAAGRLIDDFIERGECDLHEDYAKPLPAIITLRLLGLQEEEANWRNWTDPVQKNLHRPGNPGAVAEDDPELANRRRLLEAAQQRRKEPREDFLSELVQMKVGGKPLPDAQIQQIAGLTLAGGVDTTAGALSSSLIYLARHPDVRQRLIDEPALMRTAVEEFLRAFAPVHSLTRTAVRDCELGGQQIKRGERLVLLWASANRDEAEFPNADQIDIDRHPNRHVTFGLGIHRCFGSNLARMELRVALEELLPRIPDYRIREDGVRLQPAVGLIYGHAHVPAEFSPGTRAHGAS